jgi:hypothetical protein
MHQWLAYAETSNAPATTLPLLLIWLGVMIGAALLAIVPIALARRRSHRRPDVVIAIALMWALLAAGFTGYAAMTQYLWSYEKQTRLMSGYYTVQQANADAPPYPWLVWSGLAAAYAAIVVWSYAGGTRPQPPVEEQGTRQQRRRAA